jgi:glucokinase
MKEGIAREVRERAMAPFRGVPIVPAALGGDAGLAGAAALAFQAAGTMLS